MHSENRQLQARLKSVVSLERMKEALEKKDQDLAAAQKEAREKTTLADQKLALVGKLEEENAKLKTRHLGRQSRSRATEEGQGEPNH